MSMQKFCSVSLKIGCCSLKQVTSFKHVKPHHPFFPSFHQEHHHTLHLRIVFTNNTNTTLDLKMDSNSQTAAATTALKLCSSLPYFTEDSLPTIEDSSSELAVVSDSSVQAKYTTFTLFPLLPSEIRLLIWEAARPAPRFIKLYCSRCCRPWLATNAPFCPLHPTNNSAGTHHVRSKAPVPSILHACIDSRRIALSWYRLSFGHKTSAPKVYFDWERDGLYTHCSGAHGTQNPCKHDELPYYLQADEKVNIKRLAFKGPCGLGWSPWFVDALLLEGLKDVFFITGGRTRRHLATGRRDVFEEKDLLVDEAPFWWQVGTLQETYDNWHREISALFYPQGVQVPKQEWRTLKRVSFVRRSENLRQE